MCNNNSKVPPLSLYIHKGDGVGAVGFEGIYPLSSTPGLARELGNLNLRFQEAKMISFYPHTLIHAQVVGGLPNARCAFKPLQGGIPFLLRFVWLLRTPHFFAKTLETDLNFAK